MIAIKGMEMPKSCAECHISEVDCKHKKTAFVRYSRGDFARPSDCPLVEIVTCEECEHCCPDEDGRGYHCERDNYVRFSVHRNFWCADGERKE